MKKTYKVIGHHAVGGVAPGETFTAELSPFEETTLIAGGHIERVSAKQPEPKQAEAGTGKEQPDE